MEVRVGSLGLKTGVTARIGSRSSFPHGEKWQCSERLYLEKEEEDIPRERKRPREVFRAGPGYTAMGLSGGDGGVGVGGGGGGTHLLAAVTTAEAQAAEPQSSAWPPP